MTSSATSVVSTRSTRTSMSTRSRVVLKSGDKELRSRLLNKLGIFGSLPVDDVRGSETRSTSKPIRLESVPTDPAAARRTNMLRGMGYGGIPSHSPLPRQALVDPEDAYVGRRRLCDEVLLEEPLKWKESPPKRNYFFGSSGGGYGSDSRIGGRANKKISRPLSSAASADAASEKTKDNKKNSRSPKKNICFSNSVSVVHIPMRSEYSSRVKSRIWSDRYEIHENATRNTVEFAAEGWDWRSVTEDDGMFVCTVSGELVHPVHCGQYLDASAAAAATDAADAEPQDHHGQLEGASDFDAMSAAAVSACSSS